MKELRNTLYKIFKENGKENIVSEIESEKDIFPFGRENRLMAYLLGLGAISYDKYVQLNHEYAERNKYLELFDMAPRTFGQTWGETYIKKLFPEFTKATKENLCEEYPDFDGEFDLWLEGIRVEVKACRANSTKEQGSLASRAYLHSEAKAFGFKYHYQQLKPSCCDVFIWLGVCRDEILYWVLTSDELVSTGKLGSQHRNENTGIVGAEVFEGQVFMTEEELASFRVDEKDVLEKVRAKGTTNI